MTSHTTFSERHQRLMLDATDPIHRACDFFVRSSTNNKSLDFVAVNQWLHSREVWAPWPDFLVAFASQGCGDYFAYDLRQSPVSVIYIGPERTPEEQLDDPDALLYEGFDEWYESQIERYTCSRCRSREIRFEASKDRQWLLRVCPACGFQERTDAIEP